MTGLLNFDPGMFSIAQRMSWASQRQTTREEDQAYCLMGILDVHMPVLYGEGRTNAFRRLQLEIIKHSNDQSIFAWSMPVGSSEPRGLLARSPSEFRASRKARVAMNILANSFIGTNTRSFSMTNNGLRISLPMEAVPGEDGVFLAYLDCQPEDGDGFLGIFLKKIDQEQQYVRWRADEVGLYSAWSALRAVMQEVFVRDPPSSPQQTTSPGVLYHIKISREFAFLTRFRFSAVSEDLTELPRENIVSTAVAVPNQDLEALKIQHTPSKISFLVIVGVDKHRFFLDLVTEFSNEESMKDLLQSYSGSSSRSSIRTQFLDRLVKIVPGTRDAIHIGIRTTRRKMHCLNISVIPASHLGFRTSLSQAKPTSGLMIRTFETLESGFELEEVIVTKKTSRENFENSVIHLTFRDEEPIAILVFEKYGGESRGFQQIAIILGIHLNHAWADVVHVSSSIFDEGETMEKILRSYEKEEVERRQWQQSVSRVVDTGDSAWVGRFTVEVTTGMNKKLQLGTHWAAIRILRSQS
ncbi:hypothetical protein VKT23_007985 [Stygiomarasmius scandens]|uniref:DUF8212 domain-containing protein n=1 Tax=Marasmiellus scandens TaxID=2682957 RepID=A0ABR1JJX9_9AGAR